MKKRSVIILKGVILSLVLSVLFSLLAAAVVWSVDIPDGILRVFTFLIAAASAVCAAYAACKAAGSKGLLTGGTIGFLYYIALLLLAIVLKKDLSFDFCACTMLAASLVSGMLGGVLAMPR